MPIRRLVVALFALAAPLFAQNAAVTINVDAAANRHAIDPRIYGCAFATAADIADLGLTVNRWGGNTTSRYNWGNSTANHAADWYFENIVDTVNAGSANSADDFVGPTLASGAAAVITIPMMGLLPKNNSDKVCGFSIAKYGAQDSNDWQWDPDCGNGKHNGNRLLGVNSPSDTSVLFTSAYQASWVQHLVTKWGAANAGGVRYYAYDNEPALWSSTHWDIHPTGTSYDELWAKWADYGPVIKAQDPNALLLGPEEWGWSGYFYSGLDAENNFNGADRNAHGGVAFSEWLLQQAHAYEQAHGQRILDVFTLHYYPQSGEYSNDVSNSMQLMRNKSTRSLWDPTYVDASWIGTTGINGGIVELIPMMKQWVASDYPGTKTGITEYNWGAEGYPNGGTAQADILGIFGREGLDMATRWTTPPNPSYAYSAFKMYRNYDGSHSTFGDTSVSAGGPNPDDVAPFAAVRTTDRALTIMIVAKSLTGTTPATVNLASFAAAGPVHRWQLGNSSTTIAAQPDLAVAGSSISLTLPPQSITLLVVPAAASAAKGDVNGDGSITMADVFYLINYLFAGGPAPVGSGDVNADGNTTAADAIYLIQYLFAAGTPPH